MEVHELSDLLKELNRQVRCIDPSFPSVMDDEAKDFFVDNPLYFFDYLKKDVIADMLCRYIFTMLSWLKTQLKRCITVVVMMQCSTLRWFSKSKHSWALCSRC